MSLTDFSVFNQDGTGEIILPEPQDHGVDPFPEIDTDGTGAQVFAAEGIATWIFGSNPENGAVLTTTQYYAILGKRTAAGRIRFRTRDQNGNMVQFYGTIPLFAPVTIRGALAFGAEFQFTKVVAV